MADVLAEWELLEPVTLLVVGEADEAADDAELGVAITVSDHTHFDEVLRVDALLEHVEDAVLAEHLDRLLVLYDLLLNVRTRVFIDLVGHFWVVIHPSKNLQGDLLDICRFFNL